MTNTHAPDTGEEAAAKLPALHVMMAMGWEYLPPAQALALRGSERAVLLADVLRDRLTAHRFDFKGQQYPLTLWLKPCMSTIQSTMRCRPIP